MAISLPDWPQPRSVALCGLGRWHSTNGRAIAQARIGRLRPKGDGILKIGRTLGVGTSVVQRVVNQDAR
jgi:hypothetical protein